MWVMAMTSQVELEQFFEQVRAYQARSRATAGGEERQVQELLDELSLVTEMLLTAEEELRVQSEQLGAVRVELDRVWTRNETLFGAAAAAYVITDAHGMVVDANRAGWNLLGVKTASSLRRPIVSLVAANDRQPARALIGQAVAACGRPRTAQLRFAADLARDVAVSVEAHTEPQSGATLLRWQLTPASDDGHPASPRPREAGPPGDTTGRPPRKPPGKPPRKRPPEWPAESVPGLPAPGMPASDDDLSGLLSLARADLSKELSTEGGPQPMLSRVVELACRWVPGAEQASVCQFPHDNGELSTLAATAGEAMACDKLQRDAEEGPAFDATVKHTSVRVDDLHQERRWRRFTTKARKLGIRSLFACELPLTRGGGASLNLYSTQPGEFTAMTELIAPVFAARASIALAHADEVHHLHRAIESRQTIGQALGILVERYRLTPDQAFELLVSASKNNHIKLRDLAARISDTGEDPRDVTY